MALRQVNNVKGYVPTTVPTGNYGSNYISNGTVTYGGNLTSRGYPGSVGSSSGYTAPTSTSSSSSSSSGSRSSSSGSASGTASGTSTADAYNALLAAYKQNDYSDYLAQMREAAQTAYDRGMNALNNAYNEQLNSLNSNLSETKNTLLDQYNRSRKGIMDDAASSLRQAYINKMLSQKNLGQQMSALGLSGGATESTLANMANNYGNARNAINTTQNNNLYNLEGNYNNNLSQAMQAYNSAVANANLQKAQQAMSLESALANNQISALGDYQSLMQRQNENYLDLLKAAIANGASFSYDPTSANNGFNAISVNQAANPDMVSNWAALQELMNAQSVPGTSTPGVTVLNTGAQNSLADFIARLKGAM